MGQRETVFYLAILLCMLQLQAQSLAFFRNGVQLENNAEVHEGTIIFNPQSDALAVINPQLKIKNLTAEDKPVTITQKVIQTPEGGVLNFYFAYLQQGNMDFTQQSIIRANSIHPYFSVSVKYGILIDRAVAIYEAYPTDAPDEKVVVTVYFYSTKKPNLTNDCEQTLPYQFYTETGMFRLNCNFSEAASLQLTVYSLSGQLLRSVDMNAQDNISLTLPKGMYIFRLTESNNVIAAQQFSIK